MNKVSSLFEENVTFEKGSFSTLWFQITSDSLFSYLSLIFPVQEIALGVYFESYRNNRWRILKKKIKTKYCKNIIFNDETGWVQSKVEESVTSLWFFQANERIYNCSPYNICSTSRYCSIIAQCYQHLYEEIKTFLILFSLRRFSLMHVESLSYCSTSLYILLFTLFKLLIILNTLLIILV